MPLCRVWVGCIMVLVSKPVHPVSAMGYVHSMRFCSVCKLTVCNYLVSLDAK
jgi:hypothetical protein